MSELQRFIIMLAAVLVIQIGFVSITRFSPFRALRPTWPEYAIAMQRGYRQSIPLVFLLALIVVGVFVAFAGVEMTIIAATQYWAIVIAQSLAFCVFLAHVFVQREVDRLVKLRKAEDAQTPRNDADSNSTIGQS